MPSDETTEPLSIQATTAEDKPVKKAMRKPRATKKIGRASCRERV